MNPDVLFLLFWVPDGKALGILMGSTQAMGMGIVRILGSGRVALNSEQCTYPDFQAFADVSFITDRKSSKDPKQR